MDYINRIVDALMPLSVPISSVQTNKKNLRLHPSENLNAIKTSLQVYGQRKPIVINKSTGMIEAGNAIYLVAKELGWKDIAAVFVDDDKSTATGYALMDNRSALLADWDFSNLKEILNDIDASTFDMNATGFSPQEIDELMRQVNVPDSEPEYDENIETKNKCPKCGYEW